jgi:hypothetical protein
MDDLAKPLRLRIPQETRMILSSSGIIIISSNHQQEWQSVQQHQKMKGNVYIEIRQENHVPLDKSGH